MMRLIFILLGIGFGLGKYDFSIWVVLVSGCVGYSIADFCSLAEDILNYFGF